MPDSFDTSIYRIRATFAMNENGVLGMMIWDDDVNSNYPVYFLSINAIGVNQLRQLLSMGPGFSVVYPATCLADYLAYVATGERPLGFEGGE